VKRKLTEKICASLQQTCCCVGNDLWCLLLDDNLFFMPWPLLCWKHSSWCAGELHVSIVGRRWSLCVVSH